jgi:two-component system chemotaxis sensor kinase CheA
MSEMFTFEMGQLMEQLEQNIIQSESGYSAAQINEIFRIVHTIKGSAAMMMYNSISTAAHSMEDLFYYLREESPQNVDYHKLTDLVLAGMDFIKEELSKVENGVAVDGDGSSIIAQIKHFLGFIRGEVSGQTGDEPEFFGDGASQKSPKYKALVFFEEGSEMENIRAYNLIQRLENYVSDIAYIPEDILDESSLILIRKSGFTIKFSSDNPVEEIEKLIGQTVYLKSFTLVEADDTDEAQSRTIKIRIRFSPESEMENIRAYALVMRLRENFEQVMCRPEDLMSDTSLDEVRGNGLDLAITTVKSFDSIREVLESTPYIREVAIEEDKVNDSKPSDEPSDTEAAPVELFSEPSKPAANPPKTDDPAARKIEDSSARKSSAPAVISVNVSKLDQLLNLMGELVISEAMVTQNPELEHLELESFHKEARQLRKIIKDLQETVMNMRMVPLSTTFFKMHRIVRDMCRQLGKDVQLDVIGEETEVDKNIIEHISDPLMHIIRNSVDHGIEMPDARRSLGKDAKGTVILEAKNSGGDVLIIIKDDGAGLDRERILQKAKANGLLKKSESEYTDKEIQQFIFLPGFSTNDKVTSYSGRGVGMDVVSTNLEAVGGSVLVDSIPGEGSTFTLKIPLTLAIIDGMTVKMGGAKYTIPIVSIKQSFKAIPKDIFTDPDGNEMISLRGEIYNVIRLYELFSVDNAVKNIEDGILIMLENGDQTICMLADELVGEQQVVVKSIPKFFKKTRGISGCTLLGNGEISLIIDVAGLFDK